MKVFSLALESAPHSQIPLKHVETVKKAEIFAGTFQQRSVFEAVGQAECAVMKNRRSQVSPMQACSETTFSAVCGLTMPLVPDSRDRRFRSCPRGHCCCPVFHQPVDGVVGVGAFGDAFGVPRIRGRCVTFQICLRAVAAANILKNKM